MLTLGAHWSPLELEIVDEIVAYCWSPLELQIEDEDDNNLIKELLAIGAHWSQLELEIVDDNDNKSV